jgi:DnaJ-domain-containing protein 1
MVHPHVVTAYKKRMAAGTLGGLALIAFGVLLLARAPLLAPLLVFAGVYHAASNFARLTRLWAIERELLGNARAEFFEQVHRASLPRQVFLLLLAVAESDREASAAERELVRRFLLDRFADPVSVQELESWEAQRVPRGRVRPLAQRLGQVLTEPECVTLFHWACHVAFADGHFRADEHAVLQDVAAGLGFDPQHARRIFLHAKAERLRASGGDREHQRAHAPRARNLTRERALEVLGLDERASPADVRRRHRELVKKYHPDRHSHLGEVAAREASERFRAIQAAYELLAASA